jgi:hypothetical protein
MARIDEQVDHGGTEEEGKMSYLCGSIPPTTELGERVNRDGGDISFDVSRGSGVQPSPCGPWLCQPHGQTQWMPHIL